MTQANDEIREWAVVLHCDDDQLENVRAACRETQYRIDTLAGEVVLRHPNLTATAQRAADAATELVQELNGVLAAFGLTGGVATGALMSGSGDVRVVVGTAHMTLQGLRVGGPDFRAISSALDSADPAKREAMRCFYRAKTSDEEAWSQLYKVFEIVNRDLRTQGGVAGAGLMTNARAALFTRTANSRNQETGDRSRHSDQFVPPDSPMRLTDARREIGHVLEAWLQRTSG